MSASTLILLSYALLAVFLVAFLTRSLKLARLPVHLRWELAPVPHEKGRADYGGSYLEIQKWWTKPMEKDHVNEASYMVQEILFLKALFEHKRSLWWFSFPFHFGMYLLAGMAGLLVLGGIAAALGFAGPGLGILSRGLPLLAGGGYALGLFGAVGLFLIRIFSKEMSNSTSFNTYFNVVLLGSMFGTGLMSVLTLPNFTSQFVGFMGALFTANMAVQVSGVLTAHLVLAFLFLAYLPFTQMMHFVAKYFTYHEVRWDDKPLEVGGKMEKEIMGLLGQKPTWSAPHLATDGKKNWVDIATGGGAEEEDK
jgi:nitrate reductase gamma subunit